MNNDWQPGDMALCVKGGPLGQPIDECPQAGRVYVVASVRNVMFWDGDFDQALELPDAPANDSGTHCWWHRRFIKVTPPEADEFDREVIDLLRQKEIVA